MKPLTDPTIAIEMLQGAQARPLEGKELVTFLEYVYFVTSPKTTRTDFQEAAKMASKAFLPRKSIEKPGLMAQSVIDYYRQTDPVLKSFDHIKKKLEEMRGKE